MTLQKKSEPEAKPTEQESEMERAMNEPADAKPTMSTPSAPPSQSADSQSQAKTKIAVKKDAPPPPEPVAPPPEDSEDDDDDIPPEQSLDDKLVELKDHPLFRPVVYGVAAVVVGIIGYFAVNSFYVGALLDAGISEAQKGNYEKAINHINEYTDSKGRTPNSDLWLGRSYIYAGADNEPKLAEVLAQYSNIEEHPKELIYMRAISSISKSRADTNSQLKLIDSAAEEHPYISGALGVVALLNKKYSESAHQFGETRKHIDAMSEGERNHAEKHLRALYKIYLRHIERLPEQTPELPFSKLPQPRNESFARLGMDMGTEGYYNHFIIPIHNPVLEEDIDNASLDSILESLQYLAAISDSSDIDATIEEFENSDNPALLTRYITGFYQIANGDYAAAANTYADINKKSPSSYSQAYEGAARWLDSKGEPPTAEILDIFAQAALLDAKNITAQNNRGFLLLYANDIDNAKTAIQNATNINSIAPYVAVNRLALNLIEVRLLGQTPKEDAIDLNSVINAFPPGSTYLLNLAAQTEMINKHYSNAFTHAQNLLKVSPSVETLLLINNIYRIRGQSRVGIATMLEAQKNYPDNEAIRYQLLLAQARGGATDAVERLIKEHKIPKDNPYALYSNALLVGGTKPKEAISLAQQAIESADDELKVYILADLARFYVSALNVEAAEESIRDAVALSKNLALWGAIKSELDAVDARIKAINGNQNVNAVRELLSTARESGSIVSQIDLCWALIDLGEYDLAAKHLEELRTLVAPEASAPELFQALVEAYRKSGNLAKAEDARRQFNLIASGKYEGTESEGSSIINEPSGSSKEIFDEIKQAVKAKEYQRGVNLYTQLIDFPDYFPELKKPALTYQNRGALYMAMKRYNEAAQDFGKALEIGKDLTEQEREAVNYNYVFALFRNKQYSEAEGEITKLLPGSPPRDIIYQTMHARILSQLKQFDQAKAIYQKLIDANPSEINYRIELARVFSLSGDFEGGVNVLSKALDIDTNNKKLHSELIKFYRRLGKSDLAQRHKDILSTL